MNVNFKQYTADVFGKFPESRFDEIYLEIIKLDLNAAQSNLDALPESDRRGLTMETYRHFGCGYLPDWINAKSRAEFLCGKYVKDDLTREPKTLPPPSERIIIPTASQNHFNAVATPTARTSTPSRWWKQHAGTMELFCDTDALNADLIIVVEGEIDCMSIWQCSGGQIAAVAILGCDHWKKTLLPKLNDLRGKKLLLLLDADAAGKKAAAKFLDELNRNGLLAVNRTLFDAMINADQKEFGNRPKEVDANSILKHNGNEYLRGLLERIIKDAEPEFVQRQKEIEEIIREREEYEALPDATIEDSPSAPSKHGINLIEHGYHDDAPVDKDEIKLILKDYVHARDLTREQWRNVGWILRDNGFSVEDFKQWSNDGDNRYDAKACETVWKSGNAGNNPVTIATLIKLAQERGYKPKARADLPVADAPEFDAAFKKRLDEWQKQNGKINPKILPEIKAAAEYGEGFKADSFDIADLYDLTRNRQIALLRMYLPRLAANYFNVIREAQKNARQMIKELEKKKPPQTPDDRTKELANLRLPSISAGITTFERNIQRDHEIYTGNLECEVENARIERARAQKEKETTKSQIADCPVDLKIPMDCYFRDKGVAVIDRGGRYPKTKEAATTPIVPTAIYREPGKHTTAYEVAIKARGFWRNVVVDGRVLFDSKRVLELADQGGALIESAQHLCKYFAQIVGLNQNVLPEIKFYKKTGWQDDGDFSFFAYPSPDADYIVRRVGFDFDNALAVRGDAQKWKNVFAIACDVSAVARIFLGYAFAAPLVRPLGIQNAQLLLHCKSNNGKSALQKLAASFYGNPRELIKSFSATLKYRQGVATAYCDLPTFLDEPEAGADKNRDQNYSQMIYDYAEGKSNQANKRNGAPRESEDFYGTRVITSERPLLNHSDKNGAYKRMPQITCEKLFDRDFAICLHEVTSDNYGHFGKHWTEFIIKHRKEIDKSFHETQKLFKGCKLNVEETARAIIAAAVAFQYAKVMLNLQTQFNADDVAADVNEIINTLPTQDELDEASRALKDLRSHFTSKRKSFVHEGDNKDFHDAYTNADTGGDKQAVTFDISGKVFKNGEVAILPTVLRRWIEKDLGYASTDAIVAEWVQHGLLRCTKGRNVCSTRINGEPQWTHRFKAGVLFDTADSEETDE